MPIMSKLQNPEDFYENHIHMRFRREIIDALSARDAAICAESAALLKTCGGALKGAIALLEKFGYTHNAGESETVKFEATMSDDLFYSEKHKAEAALAALREAGVNNG